jgi:hypothetical protein
VRGHGRRAQDRSRPHARPGCRRPAQR